MSASAIGAPYLDHLVDFGPPEFLLELRPARLGRDVVRRMTGGAIVHDDVKIRPRFEGRGFRRKFVSERRQPVPLPPWPADRSAPTTPSRSPRRGPSSAPCGRGFPPAAAAGHRPQGRRWRGLLPTRPPRNQD